MWRTGGSTSPAARCSSRRTPRPRARRLEAADLRQRRGHRCQGRHRVRGREPGALLVRQRQPAEALALRASDASLVAQYDAIYSGGRSSRRRRRRARERATARRDAPFARSTRSTGVDRGSSPTSSATGRARSRSATTGVYFAGLSETPGGFGSFDLRTGASVPWSPPLSGVRVFRLGGGQRRRRRRRVPDGARRGRPQQPRGVRPAHGCRAAVRARAAGEGRVLRPDRHRDGDRARRAGSLLYVGGRFDSVGGTLQTNLAAVDPVSGARAAFRRRRRRCTSSRRWTGRCSSADCAGARLRAERRPRRRVAGGRRGAALRADAALRRRALTVPATRCTPAVLRCLVPRRRGVPADADAPLRVLDGARGRAAVARGWQPTRGAAPAPRPTTPRRAPPTRAAPARRAPTAAPRRAPARPPTTADTATRDAPSADRRRDTPARHRGRARSATRRHAHATATRRRPPRHATPRPSDADRHRDATPPPARTHPAPPPRPHPLGAPPAATARGRPPRA